MPNFQAHLARIQAAIREVTPQQVHQRLALGQGLIVIDIREREETAAGSVPGATWLGRGHLEARIGTLAAAEDAPIVLYCAGGVRSALAAAALAAMGYTQVESMSGGFEGWRSAGLPVQVQRVLTDAQLAKYARHLLLPEVGHAGQIKLLDAKVLLIGAGGLGSPVALYLAAAGVGTLGIVDPDVVDASNLQRQVLHGEDRIGSLKVESAVKTLRALNSSVRVVPHAVRFERANALELLRDYDLVVDGCDNFATRYLVNDACFLLRKPAVYAAIFRFDGQVSVFRPGVQGPCYRCLYPQPPPPEVAPNCAQAGVLGVLPGLVGTAQALEALKLILGIGEPLVGRLLVIDALGSHFRELRTRRDPACPLCGDQPTLSGLPDDQEFCASAPA